MELFEKQGKVSDITRIVIVKGGMQIINPKREDIIADGWIPYTPPVNEYRPTYEERVEQLIRERYPLREELSLLRQKDAKPEEYQAYYDYAEECKIKAKEELKNGKVEENIQ